MKHGCCTDKACTPATCMELPRGKTCCDCGYIGPCTRMGFTTGTNTSCDFFPRRFKEVKSGGTEHKSVDKKGGGA
jgi:hypothetical protein